MNRNVFRIAVTAASLSAGAAAAQYYPVNQGYGYGTDRDDYARQAQVVRCESTQSRSNICRIDARGQGNQVRLVRQLSRTQCVEGRNWTANRDAIRVTDGCRADFQVIGDSRYGNGGYPVLLAARYSGSLGNQIGLALQPGSAAGTWRPSTR